MIADGALLLSRGRLPFAGQKVKFRLRGHTLPRDARWQWRLVRFRSLVRAKRPGDQELSS
jgi:hypothetical protein